MEVVIRKSEVSGKAIPPPSKSYTHRAFIAASLSPKCRVENPLLSADTIATLNGCRKLGALMQRERDGERKDTWTIRGVEEIAVSEYFNFENSGTTLRLFTGLLSLSTSPKLSVVDGDSSLRKRPNRELCMAIRELGGRVHGDDKFRAPFKVGGVVRGGETVVKGASSQFISSLLFTLPMARHDSKLRVVEVKSKPYINITLDVLRKSGIRIEQDGGEYYIPAEQRYRLRRFSIPADFSSASYLIAAGLIAGEVRVENMVDSEQGDRRIVEICREMGGDVRWDREGGVIVARKSELEGIEVDASDIPDLVPTIAVLAATAKGKTRIYNAEHLKIKEIDRIKGICDNLRALGVEAKPREDGLIVEGGRKQFKGTVNSFGDHRMALAFSLLGLLGEVRCINAEVVSVSFPGYFDVLRNLGANVTKL